MATKTNSGGYTLSEFIAEYQVENITIDKYFLKQVLKATGSSSSGKFIINEDSYLIKYLDELNQDLNTVTLSDQEKSKYRYNPKLLSFDIYGTTELWFFIMWANELYTTTEFNLDTGRIKLYKGTVVQKLERILDLEDEFRRENDADIQKQLA